MNKENAQDNVDNIVYDLNSLYSAFLAAKKDSDWKPQVQKYEIDFLPNIVSTKDLLKNREYHSKPSSEFIINERGKVRPITGLQMSDRVIRHSLCDNVLSPSLIDYLIYDNGASLKGKGIDFSRKRFCMGRKQAGTARLPLLSAEPGKSQLPVDHDRQDHPAAGWFHRKDPRGERPR